MPFPRFELLLFKMHSSLRSGFLESGNIIKNSLGKNKYQTLLKINVMYTMGNNLNILWNELDSLSLVFTLLSGRFKAHQYSDARLLYIYVATLSTILMDCFDFLGSVSE